MLKDFEIWKNLNSPHDFSLYDYLFHNVQDVNSDIYFAFLELFWPTFLVYKEYIFLKENFSEEKVDGLISQSEKVEFWMNFLSIDPFFGEDEEGDVKAECFTKALVEIWKTKLKKDFPDKEFIVAFLTDEETGDYAITFYQKKF